MNIVRLGIDIIDEDPDRDRDLDRPSLTKNDGDLEAETVRETETRADIENAGVVREIETGIGGIVPNEIGIARENGNI